MPKKRAARRKEKKKKKEQEPSAQRKERERKRVGGVCACIKFATRGTISRRDFHTRCGLAKRHRRERNALTDVRDNVGRCSAQTQERRLWNPRGWAPRGHAVVNKVNARARNGASPRVGARGRDGTRRSSRSERADAWNALIGGRGGCYGRRLAHAYATVPECTRTRTYIREPRQRSSRSSDREQ